MLLKGECAMSLILEFVSCVVKNLPETTEAMMRSWVENPKALQKALADAILPKEVIFDWCAVYKTLGMEAEYRESELVAPVRPDLWPIPVVKGITCNKVVAELRKLGVNVSLYAEDLDKDVTENDRDPVAGSYLVNFHANAEAEAWQGEPQSADMLRESGVKGITLLERLLLEVAYFMATGKHLDSKVWTLCTGSRNSVGGVPSVFFDPVGGWVRVGWYCSGARFVFLRVRSVVSSS